MPNLLDRASIVLTPTAYDNGKVLCAKPIDGSGDFDFSRNSAATRVNAQGLVEDVQILSSNLVQNGDFSEQGAEEVSNGSFSQQGSQLVTNGDFATDSDWGLGANWNISNGKANAVSALNEERLEQFNLGQSINKPYKVTFSVSNLTQGSFRVFFGSVQSQIITSDGDYTIYLTPTSTSQFFIYSIGTTTGSIDNVSVVEVGQDWTFGTGWSVGDSVASCDGTQTSNSSLFQSNVLTQNKSYKFEFTLSNVTSGFVRLRNGIGSGETYITYKNIDGTYTAYAAVNSSNATLVIDADSNFIGSITNISVKEVGQNWTLGTGWSIGDDKAIYDGTGGTSQIRQDGVVVIGKKYKLTLDVLANEGNGINTIFLGGLQINTSHLNVGSYTFVGTTTSNASVNIYGRTGEVFEISNIKIIEITDDTNLPRINYEGFSYDGSGNIIPDSGCGSWLWEPQSTNLLPYSEDFSQWVFVGATISSNALTSPSGSLNADKLVEGTLLSQHRIQFTTTSALGDNTFSVFAKKGERDTIWLRIGTSSGFFNLNDGTTIGSGGIIASTIDYGNGWYRCIINKANSAANEICRINVTDNISGGDYLGNGTSGVYIWGASYEALSYATSYIPTDGTQKTRNQDVCTNGGSAASINSTEGVLYAEISANSNDLSFRLLSLSDGTTSNRVYIGFGSVSNQLTASLTSGGSQQALLNHIVSDETQYNKVALKYKLNELSLFVNGSKVATDTTVTMPTLTSLQFTSGSTFSKFFGKTKAVAVWKEALTDTELAELTTI